MSTNLILLLASVLGAVSTYVFNVQFKQGPVKASALLSLIVALVFHFLPPILPSILMTKIPLIFFGASFIGMSSPKILGRASWSVLAGLFFGFIFLNTSKFFTGFGGGLGTTACLSVAMTVGVKRKLLR